MKIMVCMAYGAGHFIGLAIVVMLIKVWTVVEESVPVKEPPVRSMWYSEDVCIKDYRRLDNDDSEQPIHQG